MQKKDTKQRQNPPDQKARKTKTRKKKSSKAKLQKGTDKQQAHQPKPQRQPTKKHENKSTRDENNEYGTQERTNGTNNRPHAKATTSAMTAKSNWLNTAHTKTAPQKNAGQEGKNNNQTPAKKGTNNQRQNINGAHGMLKHKNWTTATTKGRKAPQNGNAARKTSEPKKKIKDSPGTPPALKPATNGHDIIKTAHRQTTATKITRKRAGKTASRARRTEETANGGTG
ncbi:hypothetical protein [Escherichia coli]|uniref:hypothetical protein n=1 Tax=Escherichia coli TaxID=562 RepID=UPI0004618189|nr:hypothetical protein [Escherichia coli]KDG28247.1 hypothetical protein AE51_01965 [Escherichia coli BIDMC 76]